MKHMSSVASVLCGLAVLTGCGGKKKDDAAGRSSASGAVAPGVKASSVAAGASAEPPRRSAAAGGCVTKLGGDTPIPDGDVVLRKDCGPVTITDEVVVDGRTLTIEPGVELRFTPGAQLGIGYGGPARIVARGTKEAPIVFTSAKDKEAGAWAGVRVWGNADRSVFEHVVFEFAGHKNIGDTAGALVLESNSARTTVKDVVFRNGIGYGLVAQSDRALEGELTGCEFKSLDRGAMRISPAQLPSIGAGNVFDPAAVVSITGGVLNVSATLRAGTTYRVFGELSLERGADDAAVAVMKIEPGVTLEFVSDAAISVGYGNAGALEAVGTSDKPVRFTAIDKRKGGWGHIALYGRSQGSRIESAVVEYAQSTDSEGAIRCDSNSEGSLKDITFAHLEGVGVSYPGGESTKCKLEGGKLDDAKALEYRPE